MNVMCLELTEENNSSLKHVYGRYHWVGYSKEHLHYNWSCPHGNQYAPREYSVYLVSHSNLVNMDRNRRV